MGDLKLEEKACKAIHPKPEGFNRDAEIPYGLTINSIHKAMDAFVDFLSFINTQLHTKRMPRLETLLMPANFSSMVGEFIVTVIPQYCRTLVKNHYHNGHPDLIPKDMFPGNSILHATEGIEVKASRHKSGWQGHNPEDVWLLVFVFDANSNRDNIKGVLPKPFRFVKVVGARLTKNDWSFSGRSMTSRRTITATVARSGCKKMEMNWIYRDPELCS